MAQSIFRVHIKDSPLAPSSARPDLAERKLRQRSAWLILILLLQAELGLAWDRQWHDLVGRDQFWIPPHIMLYTGIGGAGLIALSVVLVDSIRYYQRKPGVDDTSTVPVLRLFHAPLGFVLLGFGTLTDLLAAPFDNYWHELYGIDVTLWSPFHIMGTIGGILAGLGSIFIFASEAVHERQSEYSPPRFLGLNGPEWGALLLLSAFMELTLPALTAFTPTTFGSWQLLTYPLPLALAGGGCIAAATRLTRKPGTAVLTTLLLWIVALVTQTFIPWALNVTVIRFGWTFRYSGRQPSFNITLALLPLLFFIYAILVDGIIAWQKRRNERSLDSLRWLWLPGTLIAVLAVVIPPCIVSILRLWIPLASLPPDVARVLQATLSDQLFSLLPALVLGISIVILCASFGDIWYRSKR